MRTEFLYKNPLKLNFPPYSTHDIHWHFMRSKLHLCAALSFVSFNINHQGVLVFKSLHDHRGHHHQTDWTDARVLLKSVFPLT